MPTILSDLVGTLRTAFRIARSTIDASGLTVARTHTLPNKSGTFAMLDDVGGGGAIDWTVVTTGQTLADDTPLLAVITTTQSFPLPASPEVGDEFIVRNHSTSTAGALVSVDPGAGRQITYGAGQSLAVAETLTCARGEQIVLVCRNSTTFELLTPGAVGPTGPAGGFDYVQAAEPAGAPDGATWLETDLDPLNRVNHTGSQTIATVTGLQTALDGKETSGAATAAVSAHTAAADPHPQYLLPSEANALYAPLGSGAPGGTNRQIQFNNSGVLGGSANVRLAAANDNLELATFTDIAAIATPAAPSSGFLRTFGRTRAGRALLAMVGPSGISTALQPALFGNTAIMWSPSTGTTVSGNFGTAWTARNAGTGAAQAHPTRASTNAITSMLRATFGTGTTATGSSGIQSTNTVFWRGNAAGLGGGFFAWRFGIETNEAAMRYMIGLSALNAALAGEPSVQNNSILLCKDAADANWQIATRDGTTTSKINTGVAINTTDALDFYIFAPPNAAFVAVALVNAVTGAVLYENTNITTNLPVATTFLFAHAQAMSTVGLTAKLLALNKIYGDTDL